MTFDSTKPKIVIFSGAGLSADSGIATYRGEGGIYNNIRAEDVMSAATLMRHPEVIHRFCDDRRVELGSKEPNAAHKAIRYLADRYGDQLIHLTQNIDDLCERAGYHGSFHLHGELTVMRSPRYANIEVDIGYRRFWDGDVREMPAGGFQFRCQRSGKMFRPAVVLFGEAAPLYRDFHAVMGNLKRQDLLIVIGTQGSVIDINTYAAIAPCKRILNNLHDSEFIDASVFNFHFQKPAADAAATWTEIAVDHMTKYGL